MKKVTMKEVAKKAGVTISTVSRYLRPQGQYISENAMTRIKEAIEQLGFRPTRGISGLKKTHRLGLITSFSKDIFRSAYHTQLLSGIMNGLHGSPYSLSIILLQDKDYGNVQEILKEYALDGLIILTWRIHPNLIRLIETCPKNFPVMLFNDYDSRLEANFVYSDVGQGIEMAVDYLAHKGRRKIGFLKGPAMIRFGQGKDALEVASIDAYEKYEGFKKGMSIHHLPVHKEWVKECANYGIEAGYNRTMEILEALKLPDAIICSNDELAIGALQALKEKRIDCPGRIAVMGFDGIDKGEMTSPPLTTMEQLLTSMGREGAQKLIEIAEGKLTDPVHVKFVPKLVIRKSA